MRVDDLHRRLELRQPVHDRLPFGDLRIGADAERERALDALERKMRLDQRAKRDRAGQVGGAHHQDREHGRDMAVSGGERDEARLALHQRGPVAHQPPKSSAHLLALDRFAGHQRDRLGIVGDARDGETEVGFVALLRELQRDQPPADQVRDRGADARIGERGPDQVAGEGEIGAEDRQGRGGGEAPQDDRK